MKTKKNAVNMPYTCYTGILIDNIAPDAKFSEQVTNSGFANVTISFNEFVREKDGWNFSEDKMSMSKEFPENVSYMINIMDYAGNTKEVEIHITLATYVELVYGSHNSNVGWSFGYGNYDIAGKDATLWSWINKTESLVFNIKGNVDKDFLQAKAYIYSYWKDTLGYCQNTNLTYNYGHNPSDKTWKSMADRQLAIIDGVEYFQFGGAGMNYNAHPDITGGNFIPSELAVNYPYGISAIAFRLKDYSKYSVIYQICIANHGWLEPKYNGDETSLGYTIPMSAIRMAIIPNSELQELYDFWNKDTGTFNM